MRPGVNCSKFASTCLVLKTHLDAVLMHGLTHFIHVFKQRERERERERERQRERQREREREIETEREREREREGERERERQTNRQTNRQTDRQTDRQRERLTHSTWWPLDSAACTAHNSSHALVFCRRTMHQTARRPALRWETSRPAPASFGPPANSQCHHGLSFLRGDSFHKR